MKPPPTLPNIEMNDVCSRPLKEAVNQHTELKFLINYYIHIEVHYLRGFQVNHWSYASVC